MDVRNAWAVNVSDALETSTLAEAKLKLLLWSFASKKVCDRLNFLSGSKGKRKICYIPNWTTDKSSVC